MEQDPAIKPPISPLIPSFRRWIVLGAAAIIVIAQLTDIALQREHFPFSHYPMYAHETHETTSLLRLYGTVTDGQRTWDMPIVDSNRTSFIPEMNEIRMKNILATVYGSGKPKNIEATRRVLRDYMSMYEKRRKATHADVPQLLIAQCDRLTWSLTGVGMPDSTPQVETLVSTAAPLSKPATEQ